MKSDSRTPKTTSAEAFSIEMVFVICTVIKYLLAAAILGSCFIPSASYWNFAASLLELVVVACIVQWVARRQAVVGWLVSVVGVAACLLQAFVYRFGNTYISSIMISNLGLAEDLAGNSTLYAWAASYLAMVSLMPVVGLGDGKARGGVSVAACALFAELLMTLSMGSAYSPFYAYAELAQQLQEQAMRRTMLLTATGNADQFYWDEVKGARDKPENLPAKPNVILIFVEGLSQNIVDDPRGIMPNVAAYQRKSINMVNYYNHTAATLRAIIGQLYSGYQNNMFDKNSLVSLQSILGGNGYHTEFINSEPLHREFTAYLENLGFDTVDNVPARTDGTYGTGYQQTLTDREVFDRLYDRMISLAATGQPFLLSTYTFGTHASFDSTDVTFGDGQFPEVNKFYNLDYWFGEFMKRFEESPLAQNTLVVFTTDHCTYYDMGFSGAFATERPFVFVDRIPLFFYYQGITPEHIDVVGRNSLDLTPTILDYLDISAPNYFLGQTLFLGMDISPYDCYYNAETEYASSSGGTLAPLTDDEREWLDDQLFEYYAVASVPTG